MSMYSRIKQDKQCSGCGAINQHEDVYTANEHWIKCACGHKKLVSTTTATLSSDMIIVFPAAIPDKIVF